MTIAMMLRSPLEENTLCRIKNSSAQPPSHHPARSLQPFRLKFPRSFRFCQLVFALLPALIAGCGQRNYSNRVELIISSSPPTPLTTYELRFESVMVSGDQVGLPAKTSPLVIWPQRAGTFTWLSSRSGVFTPTEPLALDTTYELSLQPGLSCADGRPSDATLHWNVITPSFGVIASWPQHSDTNAGSQPEIKIAFNADVRASDAKPFLYFRDRRGRTVSAEVWQGTIEDRSGQYEYEPLRTWKEDSEMENESAREDRWRRSAELTNEVANLLVAAPARALPIGEGWELVLSRGIPTADRSLCTRASSEVPIGDVTPFTVRETEVEHYINAGAWIGILFSKPIPESLTNQFHELVDLDPCPTNLSVSVSGRRLYLSGDFKGGTDYRLKLRPGFESVEPFRLQGSNTFTLAMPHIAPRLYFPALDRDQLAGGNRRFPLLTINVSRVRIRAKLMDPLTAVHALRGYSSYFVPWRERVEKREDEPYRPIDYNLIPGHTVHDGVIVRGHGSDESDTAQKLDLKWDDLLGGRRTGVVFVDARRVDDNNVDPDLGTQALIQLTDLGIVWKKSASGVDAFIFSYGTGLPVSGATVRLLSNENEPLGETLTDTHGVAHLDANARASWVSAQQGDDFHAIAFDHYPNWYPREPGAEFIIRDELEDPMRVMLFSDRDLYRPGETVQFEAIVREWADQRLTVPAGLSGTLHCFDARGKRFFETNILFSSLGSSSMPVPLPMASRGGYSARLYFGTKTYTYPFQVQDFQPSAFEIQIPCKSAYSGNEPIQLPVSARYLFGKSLARAAIVWSLGAEDMEFKPEKFQGFRFSRDELETRYGRGRSSISLNGRGTLTGSNFIIAPQLSANSVAPQPRAVSLLVEVTDVNQQTLTRRIEFVRHSSDFYLGLRQRSTVLEVGTPLPLEIVALRTDGTPYSEPVKARLTLQHVDWQSVRIQGAGKTIRFHNEAVFSNILEKEITVSPVPVPAACEDDAKGNPLTDLPFLAAGEYLVEVKAEDAAGRPVIASLDFQISAPEEAGWNYRNDVELTLKPDQKLYQPGDSAQILVEAPFSGTALVTVEREKVLRSFVTQLEGNAPSVRIPLEPGDVPNVFVSVTLMRGSDQSPHKIKEPEYRVGSCELHVLDPRSRMSLDITPARTNCLPGEPMEIAVRLTDSDKRPVSGAEVILYAVDDGILGLSDYQLPNPHEFFFSGRPLNVRSGISFPDLLTEDPEELYFHNKGYLGGGGGEERVRQNFLACAFWNATLSTDADGRVTARFVAPDSLTRYHVFAVAHTADSRFGCGESAFHVSKPLMIQPALPSCANITDKLIARSVVFNQTANAGEVIVTLQLDDKTRTANTNVLTGRLSIPAKGSMPVEFPVEFIDSGEAKWIWKAHFADATAGKFTDAVQSTIAVGHIAPVIGEVLLTRVSTMQTNLLTFANPQLLAGRGTITVTIANTRLNELSETASQLLHYPYGCVEQTGSSLLPWITLRDAPGLQWTCLRTKTNSAAAIRAGVARLFSMQTQSGGLGYWPHAREPMLWASAYGGMVLALAQRHGVSVPKEEFDSLLNYLSQQLRSSDHDDDLPERCLALYALAIAGRAEPAYHEKLYSLRAKLSSEDRALLALAISENRGPTEMIADLLRSRSPVFSPDERRFGCASREEAIRLLAWIYYQPENPLVDRIVSDLMHDQKEAHWGTTQGNAWALLALTEYARRVETHIENGEGILECGGQTFPFQLDEHNSLFTQQFSIAQLTNAPLLLTKSSTNRFYATVSIEARPPEGPQPRQDRGFDLQRRYDRLNDDNQPQGIDSLHVGDRVLVTLRLNVRDSARYVVIDDALPSILEAVNPEFRSQTARTSGTSGTSDDGNWWPADFREIRKDRCLSFADWVPRGTYTLRYVARVRAAGSVTAPPAKVEEMYHPEHCGLTETQSLVSEPLN
jgi:alpha-2-macroglobulin